MVSSHFTLARRGEKAYDYAYRNFMFLREESVVVSMQLVEQYVRLFAGRPNLKQGTPADISLAEVADILYCTHRNATLTLKKMQNQGWLHWQPGRGRGNRSVLTCLLAPDDLVFTVAKELVQKGDIQGSRQLIGQYQQEWQRLEEDYSRWMSSQFGLSVSREKGNGERVDTLRFFVSGPFRILDPIRVLLRSQTHLVKHIFDTLVRFDPATRTIVGQLAFFWESDELGKEWTLYLRKGVLFHHGRQMNAEDVCYSLLRLMEAPSRHRWLTHSIQSVQAIEDHIVVVTLQQPNHLFLHALSKEYVSIVPKDYVVQMGEGFAARPVGTGPFKVIRNDDSMLVLEAFQPYFAGRPFLDRVELWCVPELQDEAETNHLQLLRCTVGAGIVPEQDGVVWSGVSRHEQSFQYVSLNGAKRGPLHDLSFRAAVATLLSGESLRADLKGSRQPVQAWGEAVPFLPEEEMSAFLRDGKDCDYSGEKLLLYTYPDLDHVDDATWIQARCAQYGIPIEIVYADPEELAQSAMLREADLIVDSANVDERLELSLLEFVYAEALSIHHHVDEQGRKKVEKQMKSLLEAKTKTDREDEMKKILAILQKQHTFVPLYSNQIEMQAHPRLSGISLDAYGWVDFSRVFVRT
ncbi:SgrR family transcriptional regulator [Brevibacillus choshinensis]|uniref:SgrR family transcriptional regulator n=1 Tax=Brevibacillus choshinensis TaxID=54911 RepID=UPI002E23A9F1|nr:SgrR family transcriptional regulator [Brevibacillus choshinensis]